MAKREIPKRPFKKRDRMAGTKSARPFTRPMKMSPRDYVDVLQLIEYVLVSRFRDDPDMDDRAASDALRASLSHAEPVDGRVAELVDELSAIREFRVSVTDDVWLDALGVIDDSVHRHSRLQPGQTNYLEFAARFMP